jgi:Prokaryotic E2 family E
MVLPEPDVAYLADRGIPHEMMVESGATTIVFPGWPLPVGFDRLFSDLLLRLQAGYPDIPPDMWWFDPGIRLADGRPIPATDVVETHLGRAWQRWSRHLQPSQWESGSDGLESYLALIRHELDRSAAQS